MQIRLACIEDGLENIGFKKFAAYVRSIHQNTKVAFVPTGNVYSLIKHITEKGGGDLKENDIHKVAQFLAEGNLLEKNLNIHLKYLLIQKIFSLTI